MKRIGYLGSGAGKLNEPAARGHFHHREPMLPQPPCNARQVRRSHTEAISVLGRHQPFAEERRTGIVLRFNKRIQFGLLRF